MPGLSRVYYCNSGSEANERPFKMIRQIAHKDMAVRKIKFFTGTVIITEQPSLLFQPGGKMKEMHNMAHIHQGLSAYHIA